MKMIVTTAKMARNVMVLWKKKVFIELKTTPGLVPYSTTYARCWRSVVIFLKKCYKYFVQAQQIGGCVKKFFVCAFVFLALSIPTAARAQPCVKISSGLITDSAGVVIRPGYDEFGYNYQAQMFNGTYDSVDRKLDGKYWGQTGDYVNDSLQMKWSSEWLANVDCNFDGKLDRGLDSKTRQVSGSSLGWTTNHVEGDYPGNDGEYHHYTYFVKIVYVGPLTTTPDPWQGRRIWNVYATIQEVYNDPYGGYHGVDRLRLAHPAGLGFYRQQ
ncbi:MAG: hypothetical protein NUV78_03405 [Candidatus Zambryskibacteria bacterium]|nr:hypothetical protein [Candidatus Zambryskibacteria bacterium]